MNKLPRKRTTIYGYTICWVYLPHKPRLQFQSKITNVLLQVDRLMAESAEVKSESSIIRLVSRYGIIRIDFLNRIVLDIG